MKLSRLNSTAIRKLNESVAVGEAKLLVQKHLWDSIDDFMDGLSMDVASNVAEYDPDWNIEVLDPSSDVELKEAKQQLIEVLMRLLFAYAPEESTSESYDKNGNHEKCDKCGTLLNDMGTCPKCDDGEEDYGDDLDEGVLNEGPLKDLVRGIQNKFDPKGAKGRSEKDARKAVDKAREKAEVVLSKDFNPKNKDALFYVQGARRPLDWKQWCNIYGGDIDITDKRYAEWYNAVVTTPDGYFIRRGAEDLSNKLLRRIPGKNDKPSSVYSFDPKDVQNIADGTEEDTTKGADDSSKTNDSKSKTSDSKLKITNRDMRQLKAITNKGAITVVDAKGNKIKGDSISGENMSQLQVAFGRKAVPMATWMQFAKQNKIIENIVRYCNSINESLLTEAPAIKLSADQLMNPDGIDFKQIAKDAADKEAKAELERSNNEKIAKWKAKSIEIIEGIEQAETLEDKLDYAHSELVPDSGKAETAAGELVRAIVRIMYRDRNDGDKFFEGYGLETCGSSAQYLYNNGFDEQIDDILDTTMLYAEDDDAYSKVINRLGKAILNTLLINTSLFTTLNFTDSREISYDYISDHQPEYEYEVECSDDIYTLINNSVIDSWDLIEYVNNQLSYNGYTDGAKCARPWSHYDTSVTIENLTRDGYDYCKYDLFDDIEAFWQDLVDEHQDELTDDDDEDYEDED